MVTKTFILSQKTNTLHNLQQIEDEFNLNICSMDVF